MTIHTSLLVNTLNQYTIEQTKTESISGNEDKTDQISSHELLFAAKA